MPGRKKGCLKREGFYAPSLAFPKAILQKPGFDKRALKPEQRKDGEDAQPEELAGEYGKTAAKGFRSCMATAACKTNRGIVSAEGTPGVMQSAVERTEGRSRDRWNDRHIYSRQGNT